MPNTTELLRARYANAFEESGSFRLESSNPLLDTIFAHRSVRGFTSEALPDGTLETLVAAGQSASSSSNLQVWSVIAVEDPARKTRLSTLAGGQAHIREAPLFLAWLVDLSRLQRIADQAGQPAEGLAYLDTFVMGAIDAALAAQNAVLAAESLGLGCVYIGALRNRPEEVAAELALRPGLFALFGLCVGWPDPARPTAIKPRLPQRSVLFERARASTGRSARPPSLGRGAPAARVRAPLSCARTIQRRCWRSSSQPPKNCSRWVRQDSDGCVRFTPCGAGTSLRP